MEKTVTSTVADLGGGAWGAHAPLSGYETFVMGGFSNPPCPHTQPHAPTASVLTQQSNIPI